MKMRLLMIAALLGAVAIGSADAAINPANPDWIIYRDPFGETTAERYDGYMEAEQGETFTLHVVVNRNPPAGTGDQVRAYTHAFWNDYTVVQNWPTPNYDYTSLSSMYFPTTPNMQTWNGYVQLTNDSWTVRSMWEESAEAPYVIMSWDYTILPNAPLGEVTVPMVFRTYNINGNIQSANSLDTDPALTIKILPAAPTFDPGDVDEDGDIDADDLDLMGDAIRLGANPTAANYDLSGDGTTGGTDGSVTMLDLDYLVRYLVETSAVNGSGDPLFGTQYGDFNLDGEIELGDLTRLGTYYGVGDKWSEGNANRWLDMDIELGDLTILGTYYGASNGGVDAIPEPMTMSLLAVGGAALLRRRSKSRGGK